MLYILCIYTQEHSIWYCTRVFYPYPDEFRVLLVGYMYCKQIINVNSEQEWWVSYRSWIFAKDFLHLINSSWCLKYCIGIYSLQNSLWTEYWIIYLVSIHFGEMDRHCIHPLLKNCWNYLSYRLGTISQIRYKWDIIVCLGYNTLNRI